MARRGSRLQTSRHPRTVSSEYRPSPVAQMARMDVTTNASWRPRVRSWQKRNWELFDLLGEVHYPTTVGANIAAKLDLTIEKRDANGLWITPKSVPASAGRALEVAIGAGLDGWMRSFYSNYQLGGEGLLLVDKPTDDWLVEFVSVDEMQRSEAEGPARWTRTMYSGVDTGSILRGQGEPYTGQVYRCWRPHPRYSGDPDSGLRSVQMECEELWNLKLTLLARIESRLASMGILFVPNTMRVPSAGDTGVVAGEDGLVRYFVELFTAGIEQRGEAASAMPVIVSGPPDDGSKLLHIILSTELTKEEQAERRELRDAIAQGMELPRQTQTSDQGDTNHWGMWAVNETALVDHTLPIGRAGAAALTCYVLAPWMRAKGDDPTGWRFGIDPTRAALSVVRTDATRQLNDRGLIADRVIRSEHGFTEADKPSNEEYLRWLGVKLNVPALAAIGVEHPDLTPEMLQPNGQPGPGGYNADQPMVGPENQTGNPLAGLDQS